MTEHPVLEGLLGHRSIRRFTSEPVDDALLRELVACGQAAATSSNSQAYSVIHVTDPERRRALAGVVGNDTYMVEAPVLLVCCADLKRVDLCCRMHQVGSIEGYTEQFIAATVDAAVMAQNMMVAAEAVGLGGVYVGGIRNDPARVCEVLEIPYLVYPVFALCLGHPAEAGAPKERLPVEAVLHRERYRDDGQRGEIERYEQLLADAAGPVAAPPGPVNGSSWSHSTAAAVQDNRRAHMKAFLKAHGFLLI